MKENNASGFLKLNQGDFIRGLAVTLVAAILTQVLAIINAPGFEFAMFNMEALQEMIKIAVVAGGSYIGKNLITADNGKLFGTI